MVSSCRWQRSNSQAVRCPQEAHELHLCEAEYFKKEGLEFFESGLSEIKQPIAGALFSADKVICQLVNALKAKPDHVHLQICGDGFRAMHSTSIVNVGVRLLIETEEKAGDTSYTSIATL